MHDFKLRTFDKIPEGGGGEPFQQHSHPSSKVF